MPGYNYKMAIVDLNRDKTRIEEIPKAFCRNFLGGNGFGIKMLYDHIEPRIDLLAPVMLSSSL